MIFELFNIDCDKVRLWLSNTHKINISSEVIQNSVDWMITIIILAIIILYGKKIYAYVKNLCTINNKWRKEYIKEHLCNTFIEYKTKRLNGKYITTRMQNEAPSIYEEPQMSNANLISNNFIDHFLNNVFIDSNSERLYCILADSGMGKTTALVNLFISYIYKYKESSIPFKVKILSLTDNKVIDSIRSINSPSNTILLLDALDENIEAVVDHKSFLLKLEDACSEFRFVVLSCRTQFFPSDEEQIKESKIVTDGSSKGYASYNTFYLSPFNDSEISKYIDREFGKCKSFCFRINKMRRRKKADSIVANKGCKNLLVRPMILSHIKQLADDNREYTVAIDIYDAMVNYWLDREVGRIEREKRDEQKHLLRILSSELAQNIYENRIERKGYYINKEDFDLFLSSREIDNNTLHFRERSLLNRDATGLVKFSHKSFLEYFLAKNYFDNINSLDDFSGLDFSKELYYELCAKYFNEHASSCKNEIFTSVTRNHIDKFRLLANKKNIDIVPVPAITFQTIIIQSISSFNLRYLEFLNAEKLIVCESINLNIFDVKFNWMSKIVALEIQIKHNTNFTNIKNFKNLQYLFLDGNIGISKEKLIKQVLKVFPGITLIYNAQCLLRNGEKYASNLFALSESIAQFEELVKINNKIIKRYHINEALIKLFDEESPDKK